MPRKAHRQVVQALHDGEGIRYRHIGKASYRPNQWRSDAGWRLLVHHDTCPRLGNDAVPCGCRVDIRWLRQAGG